ININHIRYDDFDNVPILLFQLLSFLSFLTNWSQTQHQSTAVECIHSISTK
uniref:Uncharacterized protein n=1 Tax=Amphimedon queenslandica TaxID=400682 RepID=A0A1X7V032_AMPQE